MSEFLNRISNYSAKRLMLLADELQGRLDAAEQARREPIAIVGIGCRFPGGADTPEKYWQLLRDGIDAVAEVPADRWSIDEYYDPDPDAPGKMSTRCGGFLDSVDRFDPQFFGISPREARSMDPQQRLLLEVTWEALEHAGIAPAGLKGTRTAIYVGMSAADYYQLLHADGMRGLDAYTASGTAHSIASGRIAYVLGTQGPTVSLDTACSSSLVAIHHAISSLRSGESSLALAGGVNLILGPDVTIALSRARMMAPDGRCKAFDSRADGFVRGEGCGMLVLKRLSDAQADGDRILALIRGSSSNQDGRSNGLTAPNGPSQEMVLRDALANCGIQPDAVDFIETHGTGTSLGDPIEVQALGAVYGAGRSSGNPLIIGSVKANIGHLEASAGVAGLIKMVMALREGEIPRQLHVQTPNPHIPWDELPVRVPLIHAVWPRPAGRRRMGGVSSFGFSGTNVHLVLEEAPDCQAASISLPDRPQHVLAISAQKETSLAEMVARYRQLLQQGDIQLADVAHAANVGRSHQAQRVAVVAQDAQMAARALENFPADSGGVLCTGTAPAMPPRIAFVFTGQGAQYPGMARQLFDTHPLFRETLEQCATVLRPLLPLPLLDVLWSKGSATDSALIDDTLYTQPALFAVEYALARLWMSWGVRPSMVMGHSVGEITAACVAGVMSLDDALKLVATRGKLMSALPRGGAMIALMASESLVGAAIARNANGVSIAAINGPENVVISGPEVGVTALAKQFESAGTRATRLNVSHAFHSSLMAPMQAAFLEELRGLTFSQPAIDLISNVTGHVIGAQIADPRYWTEHVMAPVRFGPAVAELERLGCDALIEIGPHPTLLGMVSHIPLPRALHALPSLRNGHDDWTQLLTSLARLYTLGIDPDWKAFDAPYARQRIDVPTYPFHRERYWTHLVARAPADVRYDTPLEPRLAAMLYEVQWKPRAQDSVLQRPGELAVRMASVLDDLAARNGIAGYACFIPELDRLAAGYIVRALTNLGLRLSPGDLLLREGLREKLHVLPRHERLFARMLGILCEDGWLAQEASGWRLVRALEQEDPSVLHEKLLGQYPDGTAELNLTGRCGGELAAVLRGEADPLALLFPGGSLADTEALYRKSPPARTYNGLIGEIAGAVASAGQRPLRILEIGAGTGSTTGYVLDRVVGEIEYTFTDVSPLFLNRAKERFADVPGMHYALLDIGIDPLTQGFNANGYDLVIGANVLHATPDLDVTMKHVRSLLAPDGSLVLLEGTHPQRFGDLTVGLLDGWWAYSDNQRRSYALMSRAGWLELFAQHGLLEGVAIPGDTSDPVLIQQAVFVVRAPPDAAALAADAKQDHWLVVPDHGGVAQGVCEMLRAHGAAAQILPDDVDPQDSAAWCGLLSGDCSGVLFLPALDMHLDDSTDPEDVLAAQGDLTRRALQTVHALSARNGISMPKLYIATCGGQSIIDGESANPAQATLWGFSHVISLEHPELACTRIDLDPLADAATNAESLVARLLESSVEDQVAVRGASRYMRRIVPMDPAARVSGVALRVDSKRSYLVTGGLRGLGLRVVEWLAAKGAKHLVLMGRSVADAHASAAIDGLRKAGVRVEVIIGDVALPDDIARAVNTGSLGLPRLAGVMHAAGVLDDGVIAAQTWPRFAKVMGPKVSGSWNLHQQTTDLDFMVFFSSGASLAGSPGQANHAAANAFEDALAWYRQAQGLPTLSINWGPWAEIGAAMDRDVQARGLRGIAPADGLAALEFALRTTAGSRLHAPAQLAVFDTDWSQLLDLPEGVRLAPVFSELAAGARRARAGATSTGKAAPRVATLRERILAASPNRRRNVLRDFVREQTTQVLGLQSVAELNVEEPLRQLGLDSLMAVELRNRLGVAAGRTLPATVTFDHPSVVALVDYLAEEAFASEIGQTNVGKAGSASPSNDMTADEIAKALAKQLERMEQL